VFATFGKKQWLVEFLMHRLIVIIVLFLYYTILSVYMVWVTTTCAKLYIAKSQAISTTFKWLVNY